MRALVLFALTLASVATLTADASAFGGKRKRKESAAVVTYSAPVYDSCSCDGSAAGYGSSFHGSSYYGSSGYGSSSYYGAYPSTYGSSYYGSYPGTYGGSYYGSPYYGSQYSYPGTHSGTYPGTYGSGAATMPGVQITPAGGVQVTPGTIVPGTMPPRK